MRLQLIYKTPSGKNVIEGGIHWTKAIEKLKRLYQQKRESKLMLRGKKVGESCFDVEGHWTWYYWKGIQYG